MMSYIERLTRGDMWFEGSVISVIAEAVVQGAGDGARARHVTPQVLHSVRRLLDEDMGKNNRCEETSFILRHGRKVRNIILLLRS